MTYATAREGTVTPPRRGFPWMRFFLVLLAICVVVYVLSMTYAFTRLLYLLTLAWGITGAVVWWGRHLRRQPRACLLIAAPVLVVIGWALAAGRPEDPAALRAAYIQRLRAYEHTLYVWGGETHVGIDCSGLARLALCEAMVTEGVRSGNPRLLGPRLWRLWWQDLSAEALGDGGRGWTQPIGHARRLAGLPSDALRPGDLAVTEHGSHVLIYLGQQRWIEANPEDHQVVINRADADSPRGYFLIPMVLMRWTPLREAPG